MHALYIDMAIEDDIWLNITESTIANLATSIFCVYMFIMVQWELFIYRETDK